MSFNVIVIGINAKSCNFIAVKEGQISKLANNQIKPKLTITNINEM